MIEAPRYVLDTTVVAKWYLPDEELVSNALHVRDVFIAGHIRFIAPTQITHELASAFLRATWPPPLPVVCSRDLQRVGHTGMVNGRA